MDEITGIQIFTEDSNLQEIFCQSKVISRPTISNPNFLIRLSQDQNDQIEDKKMILDILKKQNVPQIALSNMKVHFTKNYLCLLSKEKLITLNYGLFRRMKNPTQEYSNQLYNDLTNIVLNYAIDNSKLY
jgi:hypothetical protein